MIIFEDYDKGVLSKELIYDITTFANDNNIPTIVDPKKRNFLFYQNTTLFKPNLKEETPLLYIAIMSLSCIKTHITTAHLKQETVQILLLELGNATKIIAN